jgi:hypothetical protein
MHIGVGVRTGILLTSLIIGRLFFDDFTKRFLYVRRSWVLLKKRGKQSEELYGDFYLMGGIKFSPHN